MDRTIFGIAALQLVLLGLKVFDIIAWSWWLVLIPVYALIALSVVVGAVAGVAAREDRARRHF